MSYTFSIIKPDAISKGHEQSILRRITNSGFSLMAKSNRFLTKEQAEEFYAIHKGKPFYNDLIKFMTSGRIVVMAIYSKGDTVNDFRKLIGDTDPKEAVVGSIRSLYGTDIGHNAIHGADSDINAIKEINFFFPGIFVINESLINESQILDEGALDMVKKAVNKGGEFAKTVWDATKREGRETKEALRVVSDLIQGKKVSDREKEFLKAQSIDLVKILPLIAIQGIPLPIPITPFLILLGKKVGIDILPNSHTKVDYKI
jgi:nucleoside-diphosphate kinase